MIKQAPGRRRAGVRDWSRGQTATLPAHSIYSCAGIALLPPCRCIFALSVQARRFHRGSWARARDDAQHCLAMRRSHSLECLTCCSRPRGTRQQQHSCRPRWAPLPIPPYHAPAPVRRQRQQMEMKRRGKQRHFAAGIDWRRGAKVNILTRCIRATLLQRCALHIQSRNLLDHGRNGVMHRPALGHELRTRLLFGAADHTHNLQVPR